MNHEAVCRTAAAYPGLLTITQKKEKEEDKQPEYIFFLTERRVTFTGAQGEV